MEHTLLVKKQYLWLYGQGKDLDVRTRNYYSLQIRPGDTVLLSKSGLKRRVRAIRCYPNFSMMLEKENPQRIAPGYDREFLLRELRTVYSSSAERAGILVFEFEPTHDAPQV